MNEIKRVFRASEVGKCSLALAHPPTGEDEKDELKKVFLDDSTILQDSVMQFLSWQMRKVNNSITKDHLRYVFFETYYESNQYEDDVILETDEYMVTGHPDAIIDIEVDGEKRVRSVVEIKCLTAARFRTLQQKGDWREKFASYYIQANLYAHLKDVDQTAMIFKNRDTGEMIGGLSFIKSDAYTFDRDMIVPRSIQYLEEVKQKLDKISKEPNSISECDAVGFCFYCKGYGRGKNMGRIVFIGIDSPDHAAILRIAQAFDDQRANLLTAYDSLERHIKALRPYFSKLKAAGGFEVEDFGIDRTIFVPNPGRIKLTEFL